MSYIKESDPPGHPSKHESDTIRWALRKGEDALESGNNPSNQVLVSVDLDQSREGVEVRLDDTGGIKQVGVTRWTYER